MAAKRLSVRKIKEVLRLKASGLSNRQIAHICSIGRSTVADYLSRAAVAFLSRLPGPAAAARFDAVAVDRDTMACTHVRNAFDCELDW